MTRAKCPVDDCDVEDDLDSVRPHVVHTSDDAHASLGVDDVVVLDDDRDSSSSESTSSDSDTDPDDGATESHDPESGDSATDEDENTDDMDDLTRQREQLSDSNDDESKDSEDPDDPSDGSTDDLSQSSTPSATGLPVGLPSFDTSTILILSGIALALTIGYLYLRDSDTDDTGKVDESLDATTDEDELDTDDTSENGDISPGLTSQ